MNIENINKEIKELIERNVDAYKGFDNAAENVEDIGLKSSFRENAVKHKQFAYDLEAKSEVFKGDFLKKIDDGTLEGEIHRKWMDLRNARTSKNKKAMLEECIRGEKEALDEYNTLLSREIPAPLSGMVREQRQKIESTILDLKHLEEQYK